jgi:catechol 2,3-dioxygenase
MIQHDDSQQAFAAPVLPPATRLGHVHLTVTDLERQLAFYQDVLGLRLHWREGTTAGLGTGKEDLLRLTEVYGARRVRGTTGLYHFALEFPSRRELARALARLFALRYRNYPTDHVISKTTYLDDPEGQTIELYIPSPEDGTWTVVNGTIDIRHADGRPSDGREPLNVEALLRELSPSDRLDEPLPESVKMGQFHLFGANIHDSMRFYRDVLGFQELSQLSQWRLGDVTLNGYLPHIIAFNTWQGEGASPPPANSLGIRYFVVVLPDQTELSRVVERIKQAGMATEQRVTAFATTSCRGRMPRSAKYGNIITEEDATDDTDLHSSWALTRYL